jgi:hypothetical protein
MSSSAAKADPKARGVWPAWVYGDPSKGIIAAKERYPSEYAAFVGALANKRGADINFAAKASTSFGKADWEAHQAMYAAAPVPAFLSAPASAAPSPAALPVAALIEHIDTIHAEIGAIRSLLAGLRGGSKKQKQKTRRSRK